MNLIHITMEHFKNSILSEGLTWRHRERCHSWQIKDVLDRYRIIKPVGHPANDINLNESIYFMFEDQLVTAGPAYSRTRSFWGKTIAFRVRACDLDEKRMYVASNVLATEMEIQVRDKASEDQLKRIAAHYWNNIFRYNDFISNRQYIETVFKHYMNRPFGPEVQYIGEVEPNLLALMPPLEFNTSPIYGNTQSDVEGR